jgi:hypothetical protein
MIGPSLFLEKNKVIEGQNSQDGTCESRVPRDRVAELQEMWQKRDKI